MDLREKIINIFEENGIDVTEEQSLNEIDSVQYVSIIVEIEDVFKIIVPDFVMEGNAFVDFDAFVEIIRETCSQNNRERNETTLLHEVK